MTRIDHHQRGSRRPAVHRYIFHSRSLRNGSMSWEIILRIPSSHTRSRNARVPTSWDMMSEYDTQVMPESFFIHNIYFNRMKKNIKDSLDIEIKYKYIRQVRVRHLMLEYILTLWRPYRNVILAVFNWLVFLILKINN